MRKCKFTTSCSHTISTKNSMKTRTNVKQVSTQNFQVRWVAERGCKILHLFNILYQWRSAECRANAKTGTESPSDEGRKPWPGVEWWAISLRELLDNCARTNGRYSAWNLEMLARRREPKSSLMIHELALLAGPVSNTDSLCVAYQFALSELSAICIRWCVLRNVFI